MGGSVSRIGLEINGPAFQPLPTAHLRGPPVAHLRPPCLAPGAHLEEPLPGRRLTCQPKALACPHATPRPAPSRPTPPGAGGGDPTGAKETRGCGCGQANRCFLSPAGSGDGSNLAAWAAVSLPDRGDR